MGHIGKGLQMGRLNDPRLLMIAGIGIALFGLIFAKCWNVEADLHYRRNSLSCDFGFDDLRLFGIPYAWILAAAVCLILFATYRFLDEKRRNNSN